MEKIYLIHGLMGTSEHHFQPQIQEWQNEYDVIPINLPGHGNNSEDAQELFIQQALSWIYTCIEKQGKGHIVGLSLGASVAIHLGLKYPKICESIVLTGYAPFVPQKMKGIMEQQYEMFLDIEESNPEVANGFKELHGDKWYETLKCVLKEMTYNYPSVSSEQIQKLEVPSLVLNGATEEHERNAACNMAILNGDIQAGLIPGAGHTANLQQPDIYNLIVKSFWNRICTSK